MEYIKLEPSEQLIGKKYLLQSQMQVLSIMQRYQKYKNLRKEELALKSLFRRKVTEIEEELKVLDKLLPKAHFEQPEEEKVKLEMNGKKRKDLESEIEEIKRKLERLQ